MSTDSPSHADHAQYQQYRAISIAAVVALVFGLMSLFAFLGVVWDAPSAILLIPALGTITGFLAVRKLKRQSNELTGMPVALVGTVLSLIGLVCGAAYSQYRYSTEVPEGYSRISFLSLEPVMSRPELPVSPDSLELQGKKIFVKGYVLSDDQGVALKNFAIVPDLGDCCFGGNPKLYKMIQSEIKTKDRVGFSFFKRGFGGTFRVDPRQKDPTGLQGAHYYLDIDYVK